MKSNLILSMLCLASTVAMAQKDNQEPFLVKSLAGFNIKESFVNTSGGSIKVMGTTDKDTRVEVYVNGNNGNVLTKEEAKSRIEKDYTLDVDVHDGELHATAKTKRSFNWGNNGLSISFKVYVPVKSATDLNTSGGSIWLSNLQGNEKFQTSGGSLHVEQLTGVIKGETSGGSIHVSNSKDNIDLETSGGSITADNCQGTIRLETSGGSLNLTRLSGSIKANTSGGSIHGDEIGGELITGTSGGSINLTNLNGSLDASTSAGSLHAQFKQVGKYVKLDVSAGHIDLALPAKQGLNLDIRASSISKGELSNFSGDTDKEHIRGTVNGGGSVVRADAGSGRVSLSFN
ncbi:DUF4097 family beta strand repeat-containing protein [Mucilaginibacter agri]|uniref:DUF4097 family beta strand repeat protein n=1 Tax=Mucilaginibacter agri TaxID=2695265 RepID=A0A966DUW6_9SPHI|nr:DUF4097 family beta strand repeat-containing protein [Mucilaginibacter agri]NCD72220.1 DUF4097 family beta strand repeat protein [Mucilaginibacter agri]